MLHSKIILSTDIESINVLHIITYNFSFLQFHFILGGLGSYTPSKIQMDAGDNKFQLGVSRAIPNSTSSATKMDSTLNGQKSSSNVNSIENTKNASNNKEDSVLLRPTEDAISWSGSSSSSDILF